MRVGGVEPATLAELKAEILKDPVRAVAYGDSRINTVYAEYLSMRFEKLSQAQLSPVEKAIILFTQSTNPKTLEEIEIDQTHILSLLSAYLSSEDTNKIYGILELTYAVYKDKLNKTDLTQEAKQEKFTQAKGADE